MRKNKRIDFLTLYCTILSLQHHGIWQSQSLFCYPFRLIIYKYSSIFIFTVPLSLSLSLSTFLTFCNFPFLQLPLCWIYNENNIIAHILRSFWHLKCLLFHREAISIPMESKSDCNTLYQLSKSHLIVELNGFLFSFLKMYYKWFTIYASISFY